MIDTCYVGDVRDGLLAFIAAGHRARTCVTSPPYWGLRDYGVAGQLGLEPTIAEYVANMVEVFRLVRDVLTDDGTLWLNLGDSYAGSWGAQSREHAGKHAPNISALSANQVKAAGIRDSGTGSLSRTPGLKAKDLCGIPWRVAFALQQPYYDGRIKNEIDRVWLAAMIDSEGCFFIHKRKAGTSSGARFTRADGTEINYERKADTYGVGLEICNTSLAVIERIQQIVPVGTVTTQGPEHNARRRQTIYRWRVQPNECKRLARELYPHLVAKQHQARLIYSCPSSGEPGAAAHAAMMALHRGSPTDVDFQAPPSCFEPGWYLRSDVIWAKKNCMPESVTDRPTKAHEYLFLLAKSERYYYDAAAIAEPFADERMGNPGGGGAYVRELHPDGGQDGLRTGIWNADGVRTSRNRRTVWTVATQPYSEAHFATFPTALVEPCVLAGSAPGDIVLDPFMGSGTVAQVAQSLGRRWFGAELNLAYVAMQKRRTAQLGIEFAA